MTIIELYEKVYLTEETKDPDTFIELFEENINLIENQNINIDNETYNAVMRLTADYAHNLTKKKSYKKALPYLEKAINLFENYFEFDKSKMNDVEFYRILLFDRAESNYYRKNYIKAEKDFLWLTKNNPDNDIFKNWISFLQNRKYNFAIKIIWYLIVVSLFINIFIDKKAHRLAYDLILFIDLIAFIIVILFETRKFINKRKKQNNAA